MRLTKLFNFKYLLENLKKSKGALAIFIGLVPILNFLLSSVSSLNYESPLLMSLSEISGINIIGAFVIPVIMSYCLFGYIFKKKSVDFVGSMPISREEIFVSNTVGGIFLIILLHLANVLLLSVVANVFGGFLFPISMAIDYFVLWTISYIFIFVITNLAITLSGNMITAIVVNCLLLFLIPFINDYALLKQENNMSSLYQVKCVEEACKPDVYFCADSNCTEKLANNIYDTYIEKTIKAPNHVAPYNLISNYVIYNYTSYDNSFYNVTAIIKMLIYSVIAVILGVILFAKRKMEICETSFESLISHNIVKGLVLVPVIAIVFELMYEISPAIIIFIALIIVYYFVYDLITMRKISMKRKGILSFLITVLVIIASLVGVNYLSSRQNEEVLDAKNIESVSINLNDEYYEEIYIEDKELINYILKQELNNYEYQGEEEEEKNKFIRYTFLIDDTKYSSNSWVSDEVYDYIIQSLSTNNTFMTQLKYIDNNIKAVAIEDFVFENSASILEVIKKELKNINLETYIDKQATSTFPVTIKLVSYKNHDIAYKMIPAGLSSSLENKIAEYLNEATINAVSKSKNDIIFYMHNYFYVEEFASYENSEIIIDYLLEYSTPEIIEFINSHRNDKVDLSKPYAYMEAFFANGTHYYVTNDINGIKEILINKHKLLLNTEEYNNLLKNLESENKYYD